MADRKTRKMLEIEKQYGESIEKLLARLYVEHGTMEGVAEELGVAVSTISMWFLRLGLPTAERRVPEELKELAAAHA